MNEITNDIKYTDEELNRLHRYLYRILGEVIRVCDENDIQYFMVGGSAIGVHFWDGFIPWDDDVDVGMTRDNFNRFLEVAPKALAPGYAMCTNINDPHYSHYICKVRLNGTRFLESEYEGFDMNHGIFVDIVPFDKVPAGKRAETIQAKIVRNLLICAFGKERWKWTGTGTFIAGNKERTTGFVIGAIMYLIVKLFSKRTIVNWITKVQTWYNHSPKATDVYHVVDADVTDYMKQEWLDNLQERKFGDLTVKVAGDLEAYLNMHYPQGLTKWLPEDERPSHHPVELSFGDNNDE